MAPHRFAFVDMDQHMITQQIHVPIQIVQPQASLNHPIPIAHAPKKILITVLISTTVLKFVQMMPLATGLHALVMTKPRHSTKVGYR